jgi:hypothetical protein
MRSEGEEEEEEEEEDEEEEEEKHRDEVRSNEASSARVAAGTQDTRTDGMF